MPRWLRILLIVLLIAVAIVVLFTWVFPWVERTFEQDPTILWGRRAGLAP